MKQLGIAFLCIVLAAPALGQTLVATHTIRAQSVLTSADLRLVEGNTVGAVTAIEDALGLETRVTLYAGRPVRIGDLGAPAIIERNQLVTLTYKSGGLQIMADGRALGRAGIGDVVRVMNLGSRQTVSGLVRADGSIVVGSTGSSALTN
jgi:flagellar basal body P-ring formation protein FlgA